MRAVIGQFSGPYSTVRPAKIKAVFLVKMFRYLLPSVLHFYSKLKFQNVVLLLKLCFETC